MPTASGRYRTVFSPLQQHPPPQLFRPHGDHSSASTYLFLASTCLFRAGASLEGGWKKALYIDPLCVDALEGLRRTGPGTRNYLESGFHTETQSQQR